MQLPIKTRHTNQKREKAYFNVRILYEAKYIRALCKVVGSIAI
jgi:hypothetical protein